MFYVIDTEGQRAPDLGLVLGGGYSSLQFAVSMCYARMDKDRSRGLGPMVPQIVQSSIPLEIGQRVTVDDVTRRFGFDGTPIADE